MKGPARALRSISLNRQSTGEPEDFRRIQLIEVTIDSLVRVQILLGELRQLGKDRELRDYVWWTAQDAADYADGQLAEALRQLRAGELGEVYVPSDEDLAWARRELGDPVTEEPH